MEIVSGWLKIMQQWFVYADYCLEQPPQAPVCKPFWTWMLIGLSVLVALLAAIVIWRVISRKFKLAAALRAQAERDRVDHDAIESRKWEGDNACSAGLSAAEVELRIREVLDKPRLAKVAEHDKMNTV